MRPACISAFIDSFTSQLCVYILEFCTISSEHFYAWLRMLINNPVQSLLLLIRGSISLYVLFRSKEKQVNPLLCGRESRLWPVYTSLWHLFKGKSIFKSQPLSFHEEERKNKSKAIGKLHLWCMKVSVKFSSTECGQCYESNYQGHCLMIKLACKLLRS